MSVWIRHVQTDSHQTTEYYENLGHRGSAPVDTVSADSPLEIDGTPLDLADIELVVVEMPLSTNGGDRASARIYTDRASVQPNRVLSGPAARDLRRALADRTLKPGP